MPQEYEYLAIVDERPVADGGYEYVISSGSSPIHLDWNKPWQLQVAPERYLMLGSYDSQDPVVEEIPVNIVAPTQAIADLHKNRIATMLQYNAIRYAKGMQQTPIKLKARAKGSLITYEMLILGQISDEDQVTVVDPDYGYPSGNTFIIPNVTLRFKRRGPVLASPETTLPGNLIPNANPATDVPNQSTIWTYDGTIPVGSEGITTNRTSFGTGANGGVVWDVNINAAGVRSDRFRTTAFTIIGGTPYRFSAEFALPATQTTNLTVTISLRNASTNAILSSNTIVVPAGQNTPFPKTIQSADLVPSGSGAISAYFAIEFASNSVAGDKIYFAEPRLLLAAGTTATTWRESTLPVPQVQISNFLTSTTLTSPINLSIGTFDSTQLTTLPALTVLIARSGAFLQQVDITQFPNPGTGSSLVADAARNPYHSQVLFTGGANFNGTHTTNRANLFLSTDVRRVRVFAVARTEIAGSTWSIRARLFGSRFAAAQVPQATTIGANDFVPATVDPRVVYLGEASLSYRTPLAMQLLIDRLSGTGGLYIDQIVVIARDNDTSADFQTVQFTYSGTWDTASSTVASLMVKYDPRIDYRPRIYLENGNGAQADLSVIGPITLRMTGSTVAVAILGPLTNYNLTTTNGGTTPMQQTTTITRYKRDLFPQ